MQTAQGLSVSGFEVSTGLHSSRYPRTRIKPPDGENANAIEQERGVTLVRPRKTKILEEKGLSGPRRIA